DKRIAEGEGPMHAYVDAAKRMFWPVVSSTATTLCAFLPMLFWPGVPGQFMGMLPVTLIFVLSASLLVALVYLPVMGGVTGRLERWFTTRTNEIANGFWLWHIMLFPIAAGALVLAGGTVPTLLAQVTDQFSQMDGGRILGSVIPALLNVFVRLLGVAVLAVAGLSAVVALLLGLMALGQRVRHGIGWLFGRAVPKRRRRTVQAGYRRSAFGHVIQAIAGNPVMPLVTFAMVFVLVGSVLIFYMNNNKGTEFFVESEPEQAIVYVRSRGNLSLDQKDKLVARVEQTVMQHPGVETVFAFSGEGGLSNNTGGAEAPLDTIGQVQLETIPWENRPQSRETWFTIPFVDVEVTRAVSAEAYDGDTIIAELTEQLEQQPGIRIEILAQARGPASAKPVHLRLKGDNWQELQDATTMAREKFDTTFGLSQIEDTLPLPGIDWQIDVDVEKAGRYGADVATVGAMVQLVTRGILLDTMRVPSSDEEIDIRVRLPEKDRVLSTLDTLKVRTEDGLVPLSNFITRKPVQKLAQIDRVDQTRHFDIKAGVADGLTTSVETEDGGEKQVPVTANERIAHLSTWLDSGVLPDSVSYEWTGDQEDQAESGAFLQKAFAGALGLMFIILLAQFNSVYNAVLVLLAVVLSTTGVLIGMLVMNQPFSIIMTGTGIVALAGIVVNNNIVLIDTYQEYSRYMPRVEAITRTAEARIRPVLLTTITTMAGLAPMMFGLSLDFINGGYAFNSPTSLWWKQLATAVVFGLGIATMLTLVFTPSMLALRIWAGTYVLWMSRGLAALSMGRASRAAQDWALQTAAGKVKAPEILWPIEQMDGDGGQTVQRPSLSEIKKALKGHDSNGNPLRAAE
ncbi:MAG: efflux RND transporter permease subunit, partial [Roseovarius gahaiensis]